MNKQLVLVGFLRDARHSYVAHVQRPVHHWHYISERENFGGRFRSTVPEARVLPRLAQNPGTLHEMALREAEVEH